MLNGEKRECYAITEKGAGYDVDGSINATAELVGDDYIINGEKWFASHACFAEFLLVMVVTNPERPIHEGASIILVDKDAPGLEIVRNSAVGPSVDQENGVHAYLRFTDCRDPAKNL